MLKAEQLAAMIEAGSGSNDPLVISPMPKNLSSSGSASIDFHLGRWFTTLREARMAFIETRESSAEFELLKSHYVPFGSAYVLHPGAFVLGITLEWIRLPRNLGGYVVGRSSWGRRGLVIATAVGVHPGFVGSLVLEISNVGKIPLKIRPGTAICQICLHELQASGGDYVDQSIFAGRRKPICGFIEHDEIASQLLGLGQ